jgi:DNA-binding NarL/FixJ family response regulator
MNQLFSQKVITPAPKNNSGKEMPEQKNRDASKSRRMKVLLVEDSPLLREALMEILVACPGLSFEGIAATQDQAITLLEEHPFDMLIVDIELAQGNGFEVIKATQLDGYPFPKPICVILTNHGYPQYRELATRLGVDYFFDKSMDFERAIDTIEAETKKFLGH